MRNERLVCAVIWTTFAFSQGWSIQLNKDNNRQLSDAHENLKHGKNKRDYHTSSTQNNQNQQSPSPVNYYQNTPHYQPDRFGLKPPGSPWSNQLYQPNRDSNTWNLISKCTERNLYYCKELLAKQLVQHVREMVTYRSGLDPYLLSVLLGGNPWKSPVIRTDVRTETDWLDNEIPDYINDPQSQFQRPDKTQNFYQGGLNWNPIQPSLSSNLIRRPVSQTWHISPYSQTIPSSYYNSYSTPPQEYSNFGRPQTKPFFNVPLSNDFFKPIYSNSNYETPLSFPYNKVPQDGFRESKEFNVPQKEKHCSPCLPTASQIDIRGKTEPDQKTNSTTP